MKNKLILILWSVIGLKFLIFGLYIFLSSANAAKLPLPPPGCDDIKIQNTLNLNWEGPIDAKEYQVHYTVWGKTTVVTTKETKLKLKEMFPGEYSIVVYTVAKDDELSKPSKTVTATISG